MHKLNAIVCMLVMLLALLGLSHPTQANFTTAIPSAQQLTVDGNRVTVNIFQIKLGTVTEKLRLQLKKNEDILHVRLEGHTMVIFTPTNYSQAEVENLLKTAEINEFEFLQIQRGDRNKRLFRKEVK